MTAAKAAIVIWSADAMQSEWVLSEANRAREDRKLVQVTTDQIRLPMPFDTIQCADLTGWTGNIDAPGWRKVVASIADLAGDGARATLAPSPAATETGAPLPLPNRPSIAVMPFANLSNDPDQEYFADGMMEEITGALSRFKSIFVIASSSTLSFKGQSVSPPEAGRQLGVRYVLEGSVRRAGPRVRIAVRLTDAGNGAQIWSDRFEDSLDDIFALQDRVAQSVAGVIEPAIVDAEMRRSSSRSPQNPTAYDLYLRARKAFATLRRQDVEEAVAALRRALALDPDYGPALALLAWYLTILVSRSWPERRDRDKREALEQGRRAMQVAGDDADVLVLVGTVFQSLGRDEKTADDLADRAVALNPGSALAWYYKGVREVLQRPEVGIEQIKTSMRLDPYSTYLRAYQLMWLGVGRFVQNRFDEAVELLVQSDQLMPDLDIPVSVMAACYGHLGRLPDAGRALARTRPTGSVRRWSRIFRREADAKLFLDGIDLAEGKSPSDHAG